jgi:hypothetical protein
MTLMFGRRREGALHDLIREEREEGRQFMRELTKEREEFARRLTEENQTFMREILLRNEKVYTAVIAEIQDMREQIQANTRAVLSVLDRLEGAGGTA